VESPVEGKDVDASVSECLQCRFHEKPKQTEGAYNQGPQEFPDEVEVWAASPKRTTVRRGLHEAWGEHGAYEANVRGRERENWLLGFQELLW
jgi:hypothetical protein